MLLINFYVKYVKNIELQMYMNIWEACPTITKLR